MYMVSTSPEFLKAKCLMNCEVALILDRRYEQLQQMSDDPTNQISQWVFVLFCIFFPYVLIYTCHIYSWKCLILLLFDWLIAFRVFEKSMQYVKRFSRYKNPDAVRQVREYPCLRYYISSELFTFIVGVLVLTVSKLC